MLNIDDLTYVYEGTTEGIRDINIKIEKEHIFAIIGRSGAGKTTLLQCLGRFLFPQKGRILIDETNISELSELEFRRKLGIVFQKLNLFPHMTVKENIELAPLKALNRSVAEVESDSKELMDQFGIYTLKDKYPAEVSGGQAQRVAICRAMMLKPDYLLLDEPTAALDMKTSQEFGSFLKQLKSDTSFIVVTHDIQFVADTATKGVLMKNGVVTKSGSIQEVIQGLDEETDD